ncbi:MAG: acetyl-CoA C-acetyltransferase [Candidatus Marinamargulisbacteria bacterium]
MKDGLWDVYNDVHMGNCAERCAEKYGFSREDQDEFAIESYKRALKAAENGWTKEEITPVEISTRKGSVIVDADEGLVGVDFEKMRTLRTVFKPDGTITAANASSLNDGACALLLMRAEKAQSLGLAPLATISDYGTVGTAPEWFTTAPDAGIKALLKKSDTLLDDIDLFEVNEAFAVVNLFAEKEGKLPRSKVNIHGGAIALGHPIGASGARILTTLIYALRQHKKTLGLASICIGGGEAASMIIKAL